MRILHSLGFLLIFTIPLFAQGHQLSEREAGAYKGAEVGVRSGMDYCDAADGYSEQQRPRMFAELKTDSTPESKRHRWRESADRAEWEAAGKPSPVALVWNRGSAIVRVAIVSDPSRIWAPFPFGVDRQMEYCYGTDSKLIRIRVAWYAPTHCEFLFPCQLIRGHEFFLGQSPGIA